MADTKQVNAFADGWTVVHLLLRRKEKEEYENVGSLYRVCGLDRPNRPTVRRGSREARLQGAVRFRGDAVEASHDQQIFEKKIASVDPGYTQRPRPGATPETMNRAAARLP